MKVIREVLIKIGSSIIIIHDWLITNMKKDDENKTSSQTIEKETLDELIKTNEEKSSSYNKIIVLFIVIIIVTSIINVKLLTYIIPLILLVFITIRLLPNIKKNNKNKNIMKNLPYALRQMSTQLQAGMGLYDSMNTVASGNYNELSEEFKITLNEIQYGKNYTEAFEDLSKRINNDVMDKVISQIIRTLNNGGDLSNALNTLANENTQNMRIKYKEYSEKLNSFMLIYMFIGVLLPVISFIMIIAATTVMGAFLDSQLLYVLYFLFFPMIILFMNIIIKRLEPTI